jgi:DNA modification methylase
MISCEDSLSFLKKLKDFSVDVNYSDPPYGLGSEIIIRPDGKPDYSNAADFEGSEINPEYIKIGEARLKYWTAKKTLF